MCTWHLFVRLLGGMRVVRTGTVPSPALRVVDDAANVLERIKQSTLFE